MENLKRAWRRTPQFVRRLIVGLIGLVIILTGIVLLPLPGPGWAIIFVGLAVLATEFPWAEKARDWIIQRFKSALEAIKNRKK